MTANERSSPETLGRQLYEQGWRQGAVISSQASVQTISNLAPLTFENVDPIGHQLVLVTQDCDLVRGRIPLLEAIPCFIDIDVARQVRPNNGRYFVLDRETGLLADRAQIVLLTREALASLPTPSPPFGGDRDRARRFGRWLGARYDRPALPDEVHPSIVVPLRDALADACAPNKHGEWLNDQLHEVRVAGEFDVPPPWDVAILFVLHADADVDRCTLALADVITRAGLSPSPKELGDRLPVVIREWVAVPTSRLPVLTYWQSQPIGVDQVSFAGEEAIAIEPLRADTE